MLRGQLEEEEMQELLAAAKSKTIEVRDLRAELADLKSHISK